MDLPISVNSPNHRLSRIRNEKLPSTPKSSSRDGPVEGHRHRAWRNSRFQWRLTKTRLPARNPDMQFLAVHRYRPSGRSRPRLATRSSRMGAAELTALVFTLEDKCGISVQVCPDQTTGTTLSSMATFRPESDRGAINEMKISGGR